MRKICPQINSNWAFDPALNITSIKSLNRIRSDGNTQAHGNLGNRGIS